MLETAKTLIRSNGLTVSLEHLRLDELMDLAQVPKTSFYRVWDSKDAFFARLLEELVQPDGEAGAVYDPETFTIARAVIAEHQELLGNPIGRRRVLAEAVRQAMQHNFSAVARSRSWQTYLAVMATLPGVQDAEVRDHIQSALQMADSYFIDRGAAFYDEFLSALQYRTKDGVSTQQIAATGAAIIEGFVQRSVVSPDLVVSTLPGPTVDGGDTQWHIAALAFLGAIEELIEPL